MATCIWCTRNESINSTAVVSSWLKILFKIHKACVYVAWGSLTTDIIAFFLNRPKVWKCREEFPGGSAACTKIARVIVAAVAVKTQLNNRKTLIFPRIHPDGEEERRARPEFQSFRRGFNKCSAFAQRRRKRFWLFHETKEKKSAPVWIQQNIYDGLKTICSYFPWTVFQTVHFAFAFKANRIKNGLARTKHTWRVVNIASDSYFLPLRVIYPVIIFTFL